jgi:hypothetical protein
LCTARDGTRRQRGQRWRRGTGKEGRGRSRGRTRRRWKRYAKVPGVRQAPARMQFASMRHQNPVPTHPHHAWTPLLRPPAWVTILSPSCAY